MSGRIRVPDRRRSDSVVTWPARHFPLGCGRPVDRDRRRRAIRWAFTAGPASLTARKRPTSLLEEVLVAGGRERIEPAAWQGGFAMAKTTKTRADTRTPEERKKARSEEFKLALSTLASDSEFRSRAERDPSMLTDQFPELGVGEFRALREVAVMSGADVTYVDGLAWDNLYKTQIPDEFIDHGSSTGTAPGSHSSSTATDGGVAVTACCCCCCCCGEASVVTRG